MSAEQIISAPKLIVRDLNFYYGADGALKDINLVIPEKMVTAFIGPYGCGKSTLLRTFNRMYQLYPKQRATGEILLDGENLLDKAGPRPPALQDRHGVPEAHPVPDVHPRQHRLRRQALPKPEQARHGRARGMGAEEGRAMERSEGQTETKRHRPFRRPATAPVHCPRHRGRTAICCWTNQLRRWTRSPPHISRS